MQKIIPSLWFDGKAEEAAQFYTALFPASKIGTVTRYGKEGFEIHGQPEGSTLTVEFELDGFQMLGLNGGPGFQFTPAISLSVIFETDAETEALWERLAEGGQVLMPLDKYDWSEKYGWVADKYGLSWQITTVPATPEQRITPALLFVDKQYGRAEEAIGHYISVFKNSRKGNLFQGEAAAAGERTPLLYGDFYLENERFIAMDGPGELSFNEAFSLIVNCESQEEVDHFWEKLTDGGEESQCGWLKDRFGVSWQIVPTALSKMIGDADSEKAARVTKAFLKMKKFDIQELEAAFNGTSAQLGQAGGA